MDLAWGIESTCNVIDRETQSIGYTQGLTRITLSNRCTDKSKITKLVAYSWIEPDITKH